MGQEMVNPLGLFIDSNRVYFTKNSPITVMSAPRKGHSGSRKVEAKTNIPREKNKLYFIKNGDLWSTNMIRR